MPPDSVTATLDGHAIGRLVPMIPPSTPFVQADELLATFSAMAELEANSFRTDIDSGAHPFLDGVYHL